MSGGNPNHQSLNPKQRVTLGEFRVWRFFGNLGFGNWDLIALRRNFASPGEHFRFGAGGFRFLDVAGAIIK